MTHNKHLLLVLLLALFPLWLSLGVAAQGITLNLKDADIEAVITTVSEVTGKNFIVDPRVKGKITIISSQPLDAESLYQTFLAVLDVHGFAAVPMDGVIKILPAINARQSAGFVASDGTPGSGDEYVTRVIHVQNVNAMELVPILRPLLPQDGHLAGVARSNVLVASGLAANISRLVQIIERIDRSDDEEIEVIRLRHAASAEVVRIISSLDQGAKGDGAKMSIAADERTNSLLLSAPKAQRLRYRTIIAHLDTPLESTGSMEVIFLNYASAKDLVKILGGVSRGMKTEAVEGKAPPTTSGQTVYIEADESSNALVISAPADMLSALKAVAHKLDYRRAQIHVEAVIAEVSSETAKEFGIQWGAQDVNNEYLGGIVNFSGSGSGALDMAGAIKSGTMLAVDGLTLAVGDIGGSLLNIGAVIRALGADANNNILATPSLTTMDNQEAEIGVGKEVPFLTGSYTSTGTGSSPSNPFQTYERKNVGLSLKVKPQVNEGDAVRLDITQEVSSISATTSGASDIVTNKRTLSTSVMVDDGQTIVLGGLIDESLKESEQRVPLLGDIPVLGAMFRYNKSEKVKTNLMIFLRPTIVRDAAHSVHLAGGKYQYMRAQQLEAIAPGKRSLLPGAAPLLPDWDQHMELAPSPAPPVHIPAAPTPPPQPPRSDSSSMFPDLLYLGR